MPQDSDDCQEPADAATNGCGNCPFRMAPQFGETPAMLKEALQRNYDTNKNGCREIWPNWRPGLCHTGKRPCAGYAE